MKAPLRLLTALLGILAAPAFAQAPAPTASAPAAPAPAASPPASPAPAAAHKPGRKAAAPVADGKRIDINGASEKQLETLPGIGAARGKSIIAGRPYADASELVTKKVLTQGAFDKIKDRIALANINTSSAAEMERTLKGIGDVRSKAVVAGRPYATPQDLVAKGVLTQAALDGMKDQITY